MTRTPIPILFALCSLGAAHQVASQRAAVPGANHGVVPARHVAEVERLRQAAEWRLETWRNDDGKIPPGALARAIAQMQSLHPEAVVGGLDQTKWTELGPGNFGGRIRSISIHPTNPNDILVGSVSGGLFRTLDGGQSWSPINDLLPILTIGSIARDPNDPSVLYAGTGEKFAQFDATPGGGIYKSVDSGAHWTLLGKTANSQFDNVTRIEHSPKPNPYPKKRVLLAATSAGIFRSNDSGTSWTRTFAGLGNAGALVQDLKFHPTNGNLVVATYRELVTGGIRSSLIYSTDEGISWKSTNLKAPPTRTTPRGERFELEWHRGNPSTNTVTWSPRTPPSIEAPMAAPPTHRSRPWARCRTWAAWAGGTSCYGSIPRTRTMTPRTTS